MNPSFNQTEYEKFISEEIQSIQDIDFVGFINHHGRLDSYTSSVVIPLTKDKKEMFCMSIALHHKMQNDFDEDFEPIKYNITERGNFKFITIPVLSKILFIRMKKNVDDIKLINKITSFLKCELKDKSVNNPGVLL